MLSSSATLPSPLSLELRFLRAEPKASAVPADEVELRLSEVPLNVQARVLSVSGLRPFRRRLMELGLVPGAAVRVVNVAPLGDPLELEVRHCRISIRKEESRMLSCAVSRSVLNQAFAV